jgi:hypothetical protein
MEWWLSRYALDRTAVIAEYTRCARFEILERPSLQGLGTGVIPVLEMLLQDYPDELIVLPCWPEHVPVDFTLYSPYTGRVEVQYKPADTLRVATQREIRVRTAVGGPAVLQVERLRAEGH